jgi:hypothetical protein
MPLSALNVTKRIICMIGFICNVAGGEKGIYIFSIR